VLLPELCLLLCAYQRSLLGVCATVAVVIAVVTLGVTVLDYSCCGDSSSSSSNRNCF
jgi:hypothetical protein